jgi:hypothetical protein
MDNRLAIEQWRASLPAHKRNQWSHPTTVWRKFHGEQLAAQKTEQAQFSKPPSTTDKLKAAAGNNPRTAQGGGLPWGPDDSPEHKARAALET